MRLVLCDDNRLLGEALAAGLEAYGHHVVKIAITVADGLQAVARHDPDVCLLDLRFCGSWGGLDAVQAISSEHPRTKVLVLSATTDPAMVTLALDAGAVGFLRKDQRVGQVADALRVVAAGGVVIDAAPRRARRRNAASARDQPIGDFSPRETEVLHRIVAGQGTAQMVSEMGITVNTVHSYVKSVLAKLGVHSRLEAAVAASKRGLLATLGPGPGCAPAEPGPPPPGGQWPPKRT